MHSRYGKQCFLSQVWFAEIDGGYEPPSSNAEREYAMQSASTKMVLLAEK